MDRLTGAGYDVYLVGGYLRDLLLGRPIHDIDLASSATPEEAMALFSDYTLIPSGLAHGTLTLLSGGQAVELTSFRKEGPYSDFRHPDQVWFTRSIQEDLARRDFTINAMAYHPDQGLLDPWAGRKDLQDRLIRAVGDPRIRFQEDALRIMRALRFASQMGFELEEATRAAMHHDRYLLEKLAPERLKGELEAFLCGESVGQLLIDEADIWGVIVPLTQVLSGREKGEGSPLQILSRRLTGVRPDPTLRMAALLFDVHTPSTALSLMRRLRFSNDQVKTVEGLLLSRDWEMVAEARTVWRAMRHLGQDPFFDAMALRLADIRARQPLDVKRESQMEAVLAMGQSLLEEGRLLTLADLAVKGDDLARLGYRGPAIGRGLEALLERVCLEGVPNSKEGLLASMASIDVEKSD